ncbi:peptide/nickel transport system substrate-binding protein/dipeptide transport system substrate-binding protein [Paucibacter oligotrophus]|uniref:Peptide/nickel transport system substrate-binding protein/dipeptide transport system substrate-binding protein n=1 Tax=Roseateles oligotrophus TaxID=1769250 RepID=A0A840LDQ6_9BURK|nr:peptide/nickel transport system substrate-binding protein/dipeptide transport system substrate-binding protein [Roseateles oligotrophus]
MSSDAQWRAALARLIRTPLPMPTPLPVLKSNRAHPSLSLCLGLLAALSLGGLPPQAQAQQKARPLVYCADASPEGFDPGMWDSASTNTANKQMFQGLLAFKRGTTELQPKLASAWQISPDAKSLTFTLRRGVKFHSTPYFKPTRELNADDVLFTFQRFVDPSTPFNKAFPANFIYPQNMGLAKLLAGLDRVDDYTVRFRLKSPNVTFASNFAMAWASIQSAEYAAQLLKQGRAQQINNQPVGTGPYRFKSYAKDDVLRMTANPDYWGDKQETQALIFSISREPNVRVQKLLAGECQVASALRDVDLAAMDKRRDVTVMKIQALNISYLSFNMKKAPTNNREVREALDIAVDRQAIFKALFPRGDAMQAVSAFPPAIPGYNKKLKNEYNPERAKQLLAKAGYAQGLEIDLWALPVSRPTNPNGQLMAQLIQQDWAKIGVKAHIKTYEWGEYLKRANQGEHDVYMSGWGGESGDADEFLTPNLSCAANRSGVKFCNKEFEALIDAARAETNTPKRLALYEQAQEIFKRERPWITMAHSTVYIPVRKDVQGFIMSPNGTVDFENVVRR